MAVAPDLKSVAARQILTGIGLPPTPASMRLVEGWTQAEGGLANNNPLNTTLDAPGSLGAMNSVGVKRFGSLDQGSAADAKTLESPLYAGIRQALKTGSQPDFINALGSSPWGTSRDLISRVLGGAPAPTAAPAPQVAATQPVAVPQAPTQTVDPTDMMQRAETMQLLKGGAQTKPMDLLLAGTGAQQTADAVNSSTVAQPTTNMTAPAARALQGGTTAGGSTAPIASSDGGNPGAKVAKASTAPIKFTSVIGRPYQGTHTDFGNWESDNAVDLAAKSGTPIYAAEPGTIGSQIGSLNSSNPQLGGLRLHLVTRGNEFYYAHMGQIVVKAGQTVKAGDLLGYSGDMGHLHFGAKNGDPQQILGL